jgi:hypothetical protein
MLKLLICILSTVFTLYRAQGRFRASSLQWRVVVAQLALAQNKKGHQRLNRQ